MKFLFRSGSKDRSFEPDTNGHVRVNPFRQDPNEFSFAPNVLSTSSVRYEIFWRNFRLEKRYRSVLLWLTTGVNAILFWIYVVPGLPTLTC
ncbi:hypothetical protein MTP99_004997 [Tenebrio molitor]|nr:hypothetical protein MTP99_004997 [Tenebrio molitor]